MTMSKCKVCEVELGGRQRTFCSNKCKQVAKYQQAKGERCKACKKPMKPTPIMGGFETLCERKRCIASR